MGDKKYNIISSENRKNPTWTDGVVKEHKNLRAEKLEEEVLALIKEKYGEVKPEQTNKISIKDLEEQVARLETEKTSAFEKYKLGKMTKLKFIKSKKTSSKSLKAYRKE